MRERQARLAHKFRQQETFASGYSPLYARLFGSVANWLERPAKVDEQLVDWLLQAAGQKRSIAVTLLLAAGLHRDILRRELTGAKLAEVDELADFFPTVGGDRSLADPEFEQILRRSILSRQEPLADFMRVANVQTNETGRGLCWLLPVLASNWPAIHLVDLGASAGLNLVADQRAYRLIAEHDGQQLLDVGRARQVQFVTRCHGETAALRHYEVTRQPAITSRTGGDLAPFTLNTVEDELTLMAFTWGDQVARLQRLREGLDAFRQVQQADVPVSLYPLDLPDGLTDFLRERLPIEPELPVVIYNTYMTTYLKDRGRSLRDMIADWAAGQDRPILWLQWEPSPDESQSPQLYWCAWTADLWQGSQHKQWLLGWVHPHGAEASLRAGLAEWADFAASSA